MKLSLSFTALLVVATEAFCPSKMMGARSTRLMARTDTSSLVQEALDISKKFGITSSEARLAWEAVEEIDANDQSEATKGAVSEEYTQKLEELQKVIKAQQPNLNELKAVMADEVQQVKLAAPTGKAGKTSPQLQAAMDEAKKLTEEFGIQSSQARVAWETVEEIAAAGNIENAMGGRLTDECLVDAAMEACAALDELNRVIDLHKDD